MTDLRIGRQKGYVRHVRVSDAAFFSPLIGKPILFSRPGRAARPFRKAGPARRGTGSVDDALLQDEVGIEGALSGGDDGVCLLRGLVECLTFQRSDRLLPAGIAVRSFTGILSGEGGTWLFSTLYALAFLVLSWLLRRRRLSR